MQHYRTAAALFALVLIGAPLAAQDSGGNVNMGRGRTTWLTDAELASEALKEFEVGLERLPEEEWKERSIAWVGLQVEVEERRIKVPQTFRVGDLDAGKRAEVERGGAEWEPSFQIAFPKKPPKELELTLTDVNSTKVGCPMADAVKKGGGLLGVFVHEGTLLCVFREAVIEEGEVAPA